MTYVRIFLKICEGCGVLWLRAYDSQDVYCAACSRTMRTLPRLGRCAAEDGRGCGAERM